MFTCKEIRCIRVSKFYWGIRLGLTSTLVIDPCIASIIQQLARLYVNRPQRLRILLSLGSCVLSLFPLFRDAEIQVRGGALLRTPALALWPGRSTVCLWVRVCLRAFIHSSVFGLRLGTDLIKIVLKLIYQFLPQIMHNGLFNSAACNKSEQCPSQGLAPKKAWNWNRTVRVLKVGVDSQIKTQMSFFKFFYKTPRPPLTALRIKPQSN